MSDLALSLTNTVVAEVDATGVRQIAAGNASTPDDVGKLLHSLVAPGVIA
ncbi:hypothetical protein [Rathayibacter toxicus]|nr:hypothetical protein [Rathayibacter toxicus]QOD08810.1 hypothetical protein AYW78_02875 [Rathayibacter toxicus]QOD10914.1 hypothetical protein BSG36_02825 [Rathayibacter toxicus]